MKPDDAARRARRSRREAGSPDLNTAILDTIASLVVVLDRAGRIVRFNRACEKTTGYSSAEVEDQPLWDIFLIPEEVASVKAVFAALAADLFPNEHENYWLTKDGRKRWIAWSNSVLVGEDGEVRYVIGTGVDITEQKRAAEALRESEAKYRRIIETAQEGIIGAAPDGTITFANDCIAQMLGYTVEELLGKSGLELAGKTEAVTSQERIRRRQAGLNEAYEVWLRRKDGTEVCMLASGAPILDGEGRHVGNLGMYTNITERKRAEAEREAARAAAVDEKGRLEAVLEVLPVGVVILDAHGGVVSANATYEAIWSGPRPPTRSVDDYVEYKAWWADTGQPLQPEEWASARAVQKGEAVLGQLVQIQRFDGSRAFVLNSGVPIRDGGGQIVGCAVAIMDVTDLKQAEAERERALAELEATVEAAAAGIVAFDTTGRIARLNAAAAKIIGYTPADRDVPLAELFARLQFETADGRPMTLEEFPPARALRGEKVGSVVMAFQREGQKVWVYDGAGPIRAGDGRVLGAVVSFVDVSEMRDLQARQLQLLVEVQRRASELQAVLDSMVDGVLVYNAEGRIVIANDFTRQLLGLTDSAEGQIEVADVPTWAHLRHLDGSPLASDETASARALAGQTVVAQAQIARNWRTGRDVYLSTSAAPIRGDDGKVGGAVVVVRDVSELTELDRLKDQFLMVAAHELKTPVAIMKGYAQALLRTSEEVSPRRRKMLEAVDRGANRIDGIVDDLLDVSRLLAGVLDLSSQRIDLPEMVEEMVDRMALNAPMHRLQVKAQPVVVEGDRDRLEQVLANLLDNALRYSPEGGDVEVEVTVKGREAVVSVKDEGVGMPEARQGRVFERFYRAHTKTPYDYGGMGVGLYISREIVKRHGGRMWFESQEGMGSTFSFSLPLGGERDDR